MAYLSFLLNLLLFHSLIELQFCPVLKSIAAPSFRNSGFGAASNSIFLYFFYPLALPSFLLKLPTGTAFSVTTSM
jgi:hypothetical protein